MLGWLALSTARAAGPTWTLTCEPGRHGAADARCEAPRVGAPGVRVGTADARLVSTPAAGSPVVGPLDLAAPVEVLEVGRPAPDGRFPWVRVSTEAGATGWVSGAALTPLAGVGEEWQTLRAWAVTFGPDLRPRLAVREGAGPVETVDLRVTDRFVGGTLDAVRHAFDDYDSIHEILVTACRTDGGDQPTCSTARARSVEGRWKEVTPPDAWRFDAVLPAQPCDHPAPVEVSAAPPEPSVVLEQPHYARGPDSRVPCTRVGRVTSGARAGQALIGCAVSDPGKASPPSLSTTWFAEEAADRWALLGCATRSMEVEDARRALGEHAIHLVVDPHAAPTLPTLPNSVPVRGGHLELRWHAPAVTVSDRPVLSAAGVGDLLPSSAPYPGALAAPRPEGGAVLYQWVPDDTTVRWDPGQDPGHHLPYLVSVPDCSGELRIFEDLVDLPDAALRRVGQLPDGTVLSVVRSDPAQDAWLREYRRFGEKPEHERPAALPLGLTDQELLAHVPWLVGTDPFGRRFRMVRADFAPPEACEPIVYAYADPPAPITVTLLDPIEPARADPPLDGRSWSGLALPDGSVVVGGRRYGSLFWEGPSDWYPPPDRDWVVSGGEVEAELRDVLPRLGLRGREVDEFVDAWAPRLARWPWVRLGFFDPASIDDVAPLRIEPAPDTVLRVWMEASPADGPERSVRPPLPRPPERAGTVVVEWGGVVRP